MYRHLGCPWWVLELACWLRWYPIALTAFFMLLNGFRITWVSLLGAARMGS